MSTNLFPGAYEDLVKENIDWLKSNTEDTMERSHIISIMEHSAKDYRDWGYDAAMRNGRIREIDKVLWALPGTPIESEESVEKQLSDIIRICDKLGYTKVKHILENMIVII